MDGVDNLFSQGILTLIRTFQDNGDKVIVILDADTIDKRWGFEARKRNTIEKMRENKVEFPFFLYPNNHDDGDFEVLLETLARKDLHNKWWDCFADYETCVSGIRDKSGEPRYIIPNRKAKLHTYISSQRLNNASRKSSVPANGYLTILITRISRDLNLSHLLIFEGEFGIVADSLRLKT